MSKNRLIYTLFQCFFLVLQCLIFLSLQNCALLEARTAGKPHNLRTTRTIRIKSLLPKTTCHTSTIPKGGNKGSYLKVVHRHGPCAQQHQRKANVPTLTQISFNGRPRVDFLYSEAFSNMDNYISDDIHNLRSSRIPALKYSTDMTRGDYTVTIGLGTPKQEVSLALQIMPFTRLLCDDGIHRHMLFNPTMSRTIAGISCDSPLCSQLNSSAGGVPTGCFESKCMHNSRIYNARPTKGIVLRDALSLTSSNVVENFTFGCIKFHGRYDPASTGILGLGPGKVSLLEQTEKEYHQVFSYCLPSEPGFTGYLWLGNVGSDSVKYVPLMNNPNHATNPTYNVDITGISVAGRNLEIPKTVFSKVASIIEIAVAFTWLPPIAYDALQTEFRMHMEKFYQPSHERYGSLDTCYNITGHAEIEIPEVSFHFSDDLEVKLHTVGIIFIPNESQVCLAFERNKNDDSMTVFGNAQQRTLEVVIDNGKGRIGFGPQGCI